MLKNSFYSKGELSELGFKEIGENILISKKASFYSPEKISLGNNVRIDDFCILSGQIVIGSSVHISAYTALYGLNGIFIDDYSGLSPRCTVFSMSDDFSGDYLIGPMVKKEYTNVKGGPIYIKKFSQIGASSVILPNLEIGEGVAVGAISLINTSLAPWSIYAGVPAKLIKSRKQNLIKFIEK